MFALMVDWVLISLKYLCHAFSLQINYCLLRQNTLIGERGHEAPINNSSDS